MAMTVAALIAELSDLPPYYPVQVAIEREFDYSGETYDLRSEVEQVDVAPGLGGTDAGSYAVVIR